ncbi:MAG: double-strand break repair helicase AddA, partial [Alphaproteobacteria bacterium]
MTAAPRRPPGGAASPPQRGAADPTLSVWVGASAGTGKTKVLADRALRLLLDGARPERLLCLTFTRAAAAEMALRIDGELGKWARIDDDALDGELESLTGAVPDEERRSHARRLFAAVLDAPGGLKIMTIHAFCQSLLGRFPIEAGIAPHFEVLDERNAAALMRAAQESVLHRAREGRDGALAEALAEVSGHTGEETFAGLMGKLRDARGRLRALIDRHGSLDALITATHRLLGTDEDATVDAVIGDACRDGAFDRDALASACEALAKGSDADRRRGEHILQWLNKTPDERVAAFDGYCLIFRTQEGAPRKERGLITQKARAHDPGALEVLLNEQRGLAEVIERRNAVIVARASAALLRLGGALLDAYDRHKAARARLDYDDLVLRAGALLRRPGVAPWVLYKLDGGLDHILVDEAQDTSPEQWRAIAALADEFFAGEGGREEVRTVFVVGDEKQSIFSFQGADLRELERMRAHFAEKVQAAQLGWKEVGLDLSYRSTGAVLAAVDAVFAQAAARDGVAFADHAIRHQPAREGHAGLVELWPPVGAAEAAAQDPWTPPTARRESASASARLARHIAETIGRWLDDGEILEARGRPVRAGDVMVLVRWRSAFVGELVRALKQRGVAVAGADRMVLSDQIAVMDLVALGEFLLLPDDDLTLAAVLKGPLIGLDEEALFDLAWKRRDSLWRTLARRRDERPAFARAYGALAGLLARADFVPPYELFADVLGARGGRRRLVARLGADANDPIDEFLSLALDYERSEPPSLQGFLNWLAAGDVQIKRDLEQGRDEVRVMTVHGAKGLEAPIV